MAPSGHRRNLLFSSSHPRSPGRTYKIGMTQHCSVRYKLLLYSVPEQYQYLSMQAYSLIECISVVHGMSEKELINILVIIICWLYI